MRKCMVRIGLAKFVNFLWIKTLILEYWDYGKIDLRNYMLFEEIQESNFLSLPKQILLVILRGTSSLNTAELWLKDPEKNGVLSVYIWLLVLLIRSRSHELFYMLFKVVLFSWFVDCLIQVGS